MTNADKKLLRRAVKQLEDCGCAGSEGYRAKLATADGIRKLLGMKVEHEG